MRFLHAPVAIRLIVIWGLVVGLYLFLLSPVLSASVLADDPPSPPTREIPLPDRFASVRLLLTTDEEAELAAFERARLQGPQAVVALFDTLSPATLDLVMNDIVEARASLVREAARRVTAQPEVQVSQAEEEAALRLQQTRQAAARARASAPSIDLKQVTLTPAETAPTSATRPGRPAANLTVGGGCDYATIGAAIAAAQPGDTLLIEGKRTFTENLS
ncbi:MAG TPA: hypothetical protein VLG46_15795, partial [Anaerolineae bacterium]|nr:hypothetical protein [Anaerolineae bacterium]